MIFLNKYLEHYRFFFKFLGNRIWVSLILKFIMGLLDGLGIALFFPLFNLTGTNHVSEGEEESSIINYLVNVFESFGVELKLETLLLFLLIVFVFKGSIGFFEGQYRVRTQQLFVTKMRYETIELLAGLNYSHFLKSDSGRIQSTLSGEVVKVVQSYTSFFLVLQNLVLIAVYVGLALLSNVQFALFVGVGGLSINVLFRFIFKRTQLLSDSVTKEGHGYQRLLIQMVSFFKYLKATNTISGYKMKLMETVGEIEKYNTRIGVLKALVESLKEPLIVFVIVLVLYIQVKLFGENLAVIVLSLVFFYRALTYLMTLQNNWNAFLAVSGSLKNIKSFFNELLTNRETQEGKLFEGVKEKIVIQDGSFTFSGQVSPALDGLSVEIKKNSTVAFVGASGSGKTTLINVLSGLIKLDSGKTMIDNDNIADLNIGSYRDRIGYITQEPIIFTDTLFNNVTFFEEPSKENIQRFWRALDQASIKSFIEELPERENTMMGINGLSLSGGQKQRISIARELYKEIDLLIMDEATSALDSETERAVQESIDRLKGSLTIVVVAHRLSTIRHVDEIFFMDKGRVEAAGSFVDLYATNNEFKRLVDLQKL